MHKSGQSPPLRIYRGRFVDSCVSHQQEDDATCHMQESDPSIRPNSVDYYCSKRLQGSTSVVQLNDCDKNVTM